MTQPTTGSRSAVLRPHSRWNDLVTAYQSVGAQRSWFAEGAIEGTPLALFVGPEKVGKSWAVQQLAVATVLGLPWLGRFPVLRPGNVVCLDAEYGPVEFARRVARLARGYGRDPQEVLPHIRHLDSHSLLHRESPTNRNEELRALLSDIQDNAPALIIVDPLRNHLTGSENESTVVLDALHCLAVLRKAADVPILVIHHLNKQGGYSGSRALRARADLWIEGTDDQRPTYAAIGRTLRDGDAVTKPFEITIAHQHDLDDRVASTTIGLRFIGETSAKSALSPGALAVHDVLRDAAEPLSVAAIRKSTNANHPTAMKRLNELASAGIATQTNGRWELSTTAFLKDLAPSSGGGHDHLP